VRFTPTAGNQNDITVAMETVAGYDVWAESWGIDIGALTNDVEPDGLINLHEYALGGNPTIDDAASVMPVFQPLENHFYYTHNERTDDPTLAYTVEYTTNLLSNSWTTNDVEFFGSVAFSNHWKAVTNRVPMLGKPQEFIRLKIEQE
jgi:hypothetical protein